MITYLAAFPRPWPAMLLAALAVFVAGCGGSGSGGLATSFTTAKMPISWALRAFSIGGPSSALSVVVTFNDAGTSKQNVALEADRNAAPAAYQQTYVTAQTVQTGVESMQVRFYSQAGAQGSLMASADMSVLVKPNGTLAQANGSTLGNIQVAGAVNSVLISGPPAVPVGVAEAPQVSAFDAQHDLLAITSGSVFLQVTNGTGSATVNGTGEIVGVTAGTITLTATVNNVSSLPVTIAVQAPPLSMASLTQATSALAVSPLTGNVWAAVPATDPVNGNSVVEIDASSHQIVSTIFVGSSPNVMAFSSDGSVLYVGLEGADSFARVDPVGKSLVATYSLGSTGFGGSQYPTAIAVEPGNPNVVALCQQDDEDSGFTGGCIYNNGVLLPNNMGIYNGDVLGFSNASTLWGSDPGFSPQSLFEGTVSNTTGATLLNNNRELGGPFSVFGGNLYFTNGQVVSGTTGALLGTYPVPNFNTAGVAVDLTGQTIYIALGSSGGGSYEVSSFGLSTFRSIATYDVPSGPAGMFGFTLLQPGEFVFSDGAKVYFLQLPSSPATRKTP